MEKEYGSNGYTVTDRGTTERPEKSIPGKMIDGNKIVQEIYDSPPPVQYDTEEKS